MQVQIEKVLKEHKAHEEKARRKVKKDIHQMEIKTNLAKRRASIFDMIEKKIKQRLTKADKDLNMEPMEIRLRQLLAMEKNSAKDR
jgi:hypothetical protein